MNFKFMRVGNMKLVIERVRCMRFRIRKVGYVKIFTVYGICNYVGGVYEISN